MDRLKSTMPKVNYVRLRCGLLHRRGAVRPTVVPVCVVLTAVVFVLLTDFVGRGVKATDEVPMKSAAMSDEKRLIKRLLDNYERVGVVGRPVFNTSLTIRVNFGLALIQILDLDEKNQILTTNVWSRYVWNDTLLTWDPDDYGGVSYVRVPIAKIWTPDIVLFNYADTRLKEHREAMAVVSNDGMVLWIPPSIFRSSCPIDITHFPFDVQTCHLKFSSWTYDGFKLDLAFYDDNPEVDTSNYVESNEWELMEHPAKKNVRYSACCSDPYPDLTFTITIKRVAVFYSYILVLPCLLLSFITLVIFWLPPESPAKMMLGMNVFVAFFVLLLLLADSTPPAASTIPLIGAYFCMNMVLITLSSFLAIVVINTHIRGDRKNQVPRWLRRITIDGLAKVLCMSEYLDDKSKTKTASSKHQREQQVTCETAVVPMNPTDAEKMPLRLPSMLSGSSAAQFPGEVSNRAFQSFRYLDEESQFDSRHRYQTTKAELPVDDISSSARSADLFVSIDSQGSARPVTTSLFPANKRTMTSLTRETSGRDRVELSAPSSSLIKNRSQIVEVSSGSNFRATVRAVGHGPSDYQQEDLNILNGAAMCRVNGVNGDALDDDGDVVMTTGTVRGQPKAAMSPSECSPWRKSPRTSPDLSRNRRKHHHQQQTNNRHFNQQQTITESNYPRIQQHRMLPEEHNIDDLLNQSSASSSTWVPSVAATTATTDDHIGDMSRHHQPPIRPYQRGPREAKDSNMSSNETESSASTASPPTRRAVIAVASSSLSADDMAQPRREREWSGLSSNAFVIRASSGMESDLNEIRSMLNMYMKRLDGKDTSAKVTKEWRVVARVLDRVFFYTYCATILVSLATIFPRAHD